MDSLLRCGSPSVACSVLSRKLQILVTKGLGTCPLRNGSSAEKVRVFRGYYAKPTPLASWSSQTNNYNLRVLAVMWSWSLMDRGWLLFLLNELERNAESAHVSVYNGITS
jgi:hypothetical protein